MHLKFKFLIMLQVYFFLSCLILSVGTSQRLNKIAVTDKVLNMKLRLKNHLWFSLDSSDYGFSMGYNYTFTIVNSVDKVMNVGCLHTMDKMRSGQLTVSYTKENKQIDVNVQKGEQLAFDAKAFTVTARAGAVTDPDFGCFVSLPHDNIYKTLKLNPISDDERESQARDQFVPWRVDIQQTNGWFCSGSLVSNSSIITTRACARNAKQLQIADDKMIEKVLSVPAKEVNAVFYNATQNDHDIAFMDLHVPIETGHVVRPLCLDLNESRKADKYILVFRGGPKDQQITASVYLLQDKKPNNCGSKCENCICMDNSRNIDIRGAMPGDPVIYKDGGKYFLGAMYSSRSGQGYNSWFTDLGRFKAWITQLKKYDEFHCGV